MGKAAMIPDYIYIVGILFLAGLTQRVVFLESQTPGFERRRVGLWHQQ